MTKLYYFGKTKTTIKHRIKYLDALDAIENGEDDSINT
jgi:hypothetical protein